jgi:hypothetical protein
MSDRKNANGSKSFPWKAVFGVISIIGVVALLSVPNNSNSTKSGSFESNKGSLGGLSLKK